MATYQGIKWGGYGELNTSNYLNTSESRKEVRKMTSYKVVVWGQYLLIGQHYPTTRGNIPLNQLGLFKSILGAIKQ